MKVETTRTAVSTICDRCHCTIDGGMGREIRLTHRIIGAQGMEADHSALDLCGNCQDAVYDFIKRGARSSCTP